MERLGLPGQPHTEHRSERAAMAVIYPHRSQTLVCGVHTPPQGVLLGAGGGAAGSADAKGTEKQ